MRPRKHFSLSLASLLVPLLAGLSTVSAEIKEERIERLINTLASKNKPPRADVPDVHIPADYDKEAQAKVLQAYEALLAEGEDAIPQLVKHLHDRRYSASVASSSTESNVDVGHMCSKIIYQHLEAYEGQLPRGLGMWGPKYLVVDSKGLADWFSKQKNRKLWQIQVEVLDDAIKQFEEARPEELIRNYYASSERVEAALSESLELLKKLRKDISKSEQPLAPKTVFTRGRPRRNLLMLGLPPEK